MFSPSHRRGRSFIILDDSTVRERRDRQEERPATKRRRVDSDDEDHHATDPEMVEKDPIYYSEMSSFSVFVRVHNTLFKIHREVLDCSNMMQGNLQEHEQNHGPTTKLKPLRLVNSSLEEFRAFLWLIHATTDELQQKPSSDEHLDRLFNIAALTTKYDAPKASEWVSGAMLDAAKCNSSLDACSSATLSRFVDTAVSRKYFSTLSLVVHKWCQRLWNNSAPSVPAIQAADRHDHLNNDDVKKLRGVAYYVHVQDMLDRQAEHAQGGATHLRTDPKLNNGQVMRLLAGYWSLVTMWERLRAKPVTLPQAPACSGEMHEKCCATWSRRWVSAAGWKRILGHNSAGILSLLGTLRDQLSNDDDLKSGMHMECRKGGLDEINRLMDRTNAGLADHFVGCL